ncbi:MAG: hypothetical protein ACI865_000089 [Flavobacteriaceae bacterium]|jgi:hypothetical protein
MINPNEESSKQIKGVLTKVLSNLDSYRKRNDVSYYCAKYTVQNPYYHPFHIDQLNMLTKISGDPAFEKVARSMNQDYQ